MRRQLAQGKRFTGGVASGAAHWAGRSVAAMLPAQARRGALEQMTQRRPDEVAQAVLYLCSDAAACMTGVNLPICGGKVMI